MTEIDIMIQEAKNKFVTMLEKDIKFIKKLVTQMDTSRII